jgi:SAM-dependent methyltransferase
VVSVTSQEPEIRADWFASAFDDLYPVVYAHRSVEAAAPEAAFAADRVKLRRTDGVLDLCCGGGRHSVHLLGTSPYVTGLDFSPDLLCQAQTLLRHSARLVRADMRAIPFKDTFDVIVNFFTSFGYFSDPEQNLAVVRGVAQALKRGGRFFIDHINAASAEASLKPTSLRRAGELVIRERRWIDDDRRVNKVAEVERDGEVVRIYEESVQLYERDVFEALLAEGGLAVEDIYGDFDGRPYGPDTPRMIVVGRRQP